jgi:hypothetical protein
MVANQAAITMFADQPRLGFIDVGFSLAFDYTNGERRLRGITQYSARAFLRHVQGAASMIHGWWVEEAVRSTDQ